MKSIPKYNTTFFNANIIIGIVFLVKEIFKKRVICF